MHARAVIVVALASLAVLLGPTVPSALASAGQDSVLTDDHALLEASDAAVAATLDELRDLGVDRVRATVRWRALAPDPAAATKPAGFDAANPSAYPAAAWAPYDRLVTLARDRSIAVSLVLAGPAPNWATGTPPGRPEIDETFDPRATEYGLFVRAAGVRYSGGYVLPATGAALPRVRGWSIWDEPNRADALTPQWLRDPRDPKRWVETAPQVYRALVDAAWEALVATGHRNDTILIGETAPHGATATRGISSSIDPQRFLRQLYCLDDFLQPLQGSSAQVRGCPVAHPVLELKRTHPALFAIAGWAHHPLDPRRAPDAKPAHDEASVTLGNVGTLARLLRRVQARFGRPAGAVRLHLTRSGFESRPADPKGVSLATQAAHLDQAEFLAWSQPLVASLGQVLLRDGGAPVASTLQTGLRTAGGARKPAWRAYALPLWLPDADVAPGQRLRVWGLARAGLNGVAQRVRIQLRAAGTSRWRTAHTVSTTATRGYLDVTIPVAGSGAVRLTWSGRTSREAPFRVG